MTDVRRRVRAAFAGLAVWVAAVPCWAEKVPDAKDQVLLDGRCDQREYREALSMELGDSAWLRVVRNGRYLALCFPLPSGSLGTLDLFLVTPKETVPVHLHVSGQLGERVLTVGEWPEMTWWDVRGWAGPWVGLDGFEGQGAERRATFHPSEARELFLDLERFGLGHWLFRVELRRLSTATGDQDRTVFFPRDTLREVTAGWATFEVPDPFAGAASGVDSLDVEYVGFRAIDLMDWSRWQEPSRPDSLRLFVWYRASASGEPATIGRLAELISTRTPAKEREGAGKGLVERRNFNADIEAARGEIHHRGGTLSDAGARTLFALPTGSILDAPPAPAAKPRPWILLASPLPPWAHDALCERLVRAGFSVVQVRPDDTHDLELAVLEAPDQLPGLDRERLGLIGFGSGSPRAAVFAMRHAGLTAWLSLDGAEGWRSGYETLARDPDFDPALLRAPWLRFIALGRPAQDRRLFDSATALSGWEIGIPGLRPNGDHAPLALSSLARREKLVPGLVGGAEGNPESLVELAEFIDDSVTSFFAERFSRPKGALLSWRPQRAPRRPAGITETPLLPRSGQ